MDDVRPLLKPNGLLDAPPPPEIADLIHRGAMFFLNHSGGRDSQATFHYIHRHVPTNQITVIHALLPEVEWEGVEEHVINTTYGIPVLTCKSRRTLLEMIEERGMFPSPKNRQCTSDLKRGPIERTVRRTGVTLVVNCMGMRAQESPSRSKMETFKLNQKNTNSKREWYDWLPIHHWLLDEVMEAISSVGQKSHWAYERGMTRLSCCFCIMSSKQDLTTAAKLNPELYRKYVSLEKTTGHVMMMPTKRDGRRTLEQITGVLAYPE